MDLDLLLQQWDAHNQLIAVIIGMPRLLTLVMVLPAMAGSIVTGQLRFVVAVACYLVLHPAITASLPPCGAFTLAVALGNGALIIKEIFIGFILGYLGGIPFWAAECAGFFIDNQRGAGQASVTDTMSGDETSPTGSFLMQSVMYVFFASGAFLTFLGLVFASYEFWPVTALWPRDIFCDMRIPAFFATLVGGLMKQVITLSGPVIVACLMADCALGLINRFASQLNVYVLAMPVKSALAALLLLLYYGTVISGAIPMFDQIATEADHIRNLLP